MKPSIAVARTALGIAAWAWAVVVAAHPLAAQDTAVHVGAGTLVAWPTGSLSAYLATGYGVGAFVEFAPTRALHLRLDADFVPFSSAVRLVTRPLEVDRIAVPMPPRTRGRRSLRA